MHSVQDSVHSISTFATLDRLFCQRLARRFLVSRAQEGIQ